MASFILLYICILYNHAVAFPVDQISPSSFNKNQIIQIDGIVSGIQHEEFKDIRKSLKFKLLSENSKSFVKVTYYYWYKGINFASSDLTEGDKISLEGEYWPSSGDSNFRGLLTVNQKYSSVLNPQLN